MKTHSITIVQYTVSGCLENRELLRQQIFPILSIFGGRGTPVSQAPPEKFSPPPPKEKYLFSKGGGEEANLEIFDVYNNWNVHFQ